MRVLIEDENILIDGNVLGYYPYYFAIWNDTADYRFTVKSVLSQWATALASLRSSEDAVYLPYYLNDQSCKYLKAELDGENVILTDIRVRDAGYAMVLDDLSPEMFSAPEIIESYVDVKGQRHDSAPKFFGRYKVKELIEALRHPEIVAA